MGTRIDASVRSHLSKLCHLVRSRAVTKQTFFLENAYILHACATGSELPFNISTIYIIQAVIRIRILNCTDPDSCQNSCSIKFKELFTGQIQVKLSTISRAFL